ncbi:hypothetical protein TNCV_389291 [Trichonephila clavipes]|nr:hypothetical protein TNCV_389291 [Trichonephila clavipes]
MAVNETRMLAQRFPKWIKFGLWCQRDWTNNSLAILLWTRGLPRQLTVALRTQWAIVFKGNKMATVGRKSLVFGACVGHLQDQGSTHLGPQMRKREGEKWTAPDVLKVLEKPKEKKKDRKRRGLVVFGKRKRRELGVLDRDAHDES